MLIRNEDIFIERTIRNVIDFCDKIIIADHGSVDSTFEICSKLAMEFPKIDLRAIQHPRESSDAISPYYGTNTWIFAVDGDEIYDPVGLMLMREYLLAGKFNQSWCIFGNVLNVIGLDIEKKLAKGYLAPPSRSITKLYNFSIITDWLDCTNERLHGGKILFKEGYHSGMRRYLHEEVSWDFSYFRCLHMAFLTRSSLDKDTLILTRLNPDELQKIEAGDGFISKKLMILRMRLKQLFRTDWKNQKYRRGSLILKDVSVFLIPENV